MFPTSTFRLEQRWNVYFKTLFFALILLSLQFTFLKVYSLSKTDRARKELADTSKQLQKAVSKEQKVRLYVRRSIAYEGLKQLNNAIIELTKAMRIKPKTIYFYCRRGDLYEQMEKYGKAQRDFRLALNVVPVTGKDYYHRASALSNLNRYSECMKACHQAINKQYTSHKVYRLLGKCYFRNDNFREARKYLEKAISLKRTVTTYRYLSKCCRKLKDLKAANSYIEKAYAMHPDAGIVLLERAIVKYIRKDLKEARKSYLAWSRAEPVAALAYPNWQSFQVYCETEKKIDYYSEMIAISAKKNAASIYERAVLHLNLSHYEITASQMDRYLKLTDWQGKSGIMATSYAVVCFRLAGKSEHAHMLVKTADKKLQYKSWPLPIYYYLKSAISKKQLLSKCLNKEMKTQAYCFIGLTSLYNNKRTAAFQSFEWVKKNGDSRLDEYNISVFELNRIIRRKNLQKVR